MTQGTDISRILFETNESSDFLIQIFKISVKSKQQTKSILIGLGKSINTVPSLCSFFLVPPEIQGVK